MMRLLIVDDEAHIADGLYEFYPQQKYQHGCTQVPFRCGSAGLAE